MRDVITAEDALDLVARGKHPLVDVRSEGECAQGIVPGFVARPILSDDERHAVGTTYKQAGQEAAMALGVTLTAPHRAARIAGWRAVPPPKSGATTCNVPVVVTCWRGGLRSQIACAWLAEDGAATLRIDGGYKAMRRSLLARLTAPPPPLLVIAGRTGSGKTRLLGALPPGLALDLEAHAGHRGSAFGGLGLPAQPSQTTFENAVALALRGRTGTTVVEDESAAIGRVRVPTALFVALLAAPLVYLEASLEERVRNIFDEYVAAPLARGMTAEALELALTASVRRTGRRLGGELAQRVCREITAACREPAPRLEAHAGWIGAMLVQYYDKQYDYVFTKAQRQIVLRAELEECRRWISARYV